MAWDKLNVMEQAFKVQGLDPISKWLALRPVLLFLPLFLVLAQNSHCAEDPRVRDGQLDNGRDPDPEQERWKDA